MILLAFLSDLSMFLTLFIDNLTIIPDPISELWNLQILMAVLPYNETKYEENDSAEHLKANAVVVMESKWEGKTGKNLQTLNRLSLESCIEDVSERARNLKTLGI